MDAKKRAELKKQAKKREEKKTHKKNYGMQWKMEAAGQMYAPSRDFARAYPRMIQIVINCFSENYWPELFGIYCKATEAAYGWDVDKAFDELEKAKDIYCKFLNESLVDPAEECDDVLQRVGWLDVKHETQATWLAMLGQVMTGQLFVGVRDLHMQVPEVHKDDAAVMEDLVRSSQQARRAMNGLSKEKEERAVTSALVRNAIREARANGVSFDDISELVKDVEFGRVSTEADAKVLPRDKRPC